MMNSNVKMQCPLEVLTKYRIFQPSGMQSAQVTAQVRAERAAPLSRACFLKAGNFGRRTSIQELRPNHRAYLGNEQELQKLKLAVVYFGIIVLIQNPSEATSMCENGVLAQRQTCNLLAHYRSSRASP